ncbi:hypothetical protein NUSPORA_01822 [Nucleospora cyclopteri]
MSNFLESSSEEDIITRKRAIKMKQESSSNLVEDEEYENELDPLFLEIFGTGHEYDYIYENIEEEELDERKTEIEYDEEDCCKYVRKYFLNVEKETIDLLLKGNCVEFVAFHCDKGTIKEIWELEKRVEEYKEYVQLKSKNKQNVGDTLYALKLYKGENENLKFPGILPINKFAENLLNQERIYEPEGEIRDDFEKSAEYKKTVIAIGNNNIFRDRIYRIYYEIIREELEHSEFTAKKEELTNQIVTKAKTKVTENLLKFFIGEINKQYSLCNQIIIDAFMQIDINIISEIHAELTESGQIGGAGSLQEAVNLLVSLKGRDGEYVGLFMDQKLIKLVVISRDAEIISRHIFNAWETNKVYECINNRPIVITSNNPNVKFLMSDLKTACYYLPKCFSVFREEGEFSIPYDVACCVQNPVLYFSRVIFKFGDFLYFNDLDFKNNVAHGILYKKILLEKAVKIAAAVDNLDWTLTLRHKHGFHFLKLLDISLIDKPYDFESIKEMSKLETVFNSVEMNKIYTYFVLNNSKNRMDALNIHPMNRRVIKVIADCVFNLNQTDFHQDDPISFLIDNFHLTQNLNFDNLTHTGFIHPMKALGMIEKREKFFPGATDEMIFKDTVVKICNLSPVKNDYKKYSGTVYKIGNDFYLIDVNGATVYVKKYLSLELNQIVQVEIIGPNYPTLSYNGEIIVKDEERINFKNHRLYINQNEEEILKKGSVLFVRNSSHRNCCVVVLRLDEKVMLKYRLEEKSANNETTYLLKRPEKEYSFDSIDEFIEKYLKLVERFIQKISNFKHFKINPTEAENYVKGEGEISQVDTTGKYALFLSEKHPGYLELLFGHLKVLVRIELNYLVHKGQKYRSVEELTNYFKRNYNKMVQQQ